MVKFRTLGGAATAVMLLTGVTALPGHVYAQTAHSAQDIDVPAGPLGNAIAQLGRKTGVMIVFDPSLVRGKRSTGLHGRYSPAEALNRLLSGTGFVARPDGRGGFILVASAVARSASKAPARVEAIMREAGDPVTEDILVTGLRATTATKTDTPIREIPQSISVITEEQIRDRGMIRLQETVRYAAGVRTEPNGVTISQDYMLGRGGFEVSPYLNGTMIQNPRGTYAPLLDTFTLGRVEFLRGPSSVLYGQGTPGGTLNAISKLPQFAFGGEVGLQYGSFDRKQVQVDIGGSLNSEGTIAGRVVGLVRDAGNQLDYGRDDRWLIMPSFRWRPSGNTDISLLYLHQDDRTRGISQNLPIQATLLAEPGRRLEDTTFLGEPTNEGRHAKGDFVTMLITQKLASNIFFRSSTRYSNSSSDSKGVLLNVWSGAQNPFLNAERTLLGRSLNNFHNKMTGITSDNNLSAGFATGPLTHQILAGIDYNRAKYKSDTAYIAIDPIDIYEPVYSGVPDITYRPTGRQTASQLGFYIQDQIQYEDVASFVFGVRRDRAKIATVGSRTSVTNATTFRLGATVNVAPGVTPYVSYSESFLPITGVNFNGEPYKPQRGRQYEAGVKWEPLLGSLITVSAFDIVSSNLIKDDPNNARNKLQIGLVKSQGLEFEAQLSLPELWDVTLSYAYVDAKTAGSLKPLENGLPIRSTPKHLASIWVGKHIDLGNEAALRLGGGVRYTGPTIEATAIGAVINRQQSPEFTLVDALAALDWQDWSLAINATNLLDNRYYASCGYYTACAVGQHRTVIGTLSYRF